jgi:hypothetical protein
MSNKDDTSRWIATNERWIPKDVANRWYIPVLRPIPSTASTSAGYDVILTHDDRYWLVGANDQECNGERIGPYNTLDQAQTAAEMLEATNS